MPFKLTVAMRLISFDDHKMCTQPAHASVVSGKGMVENNGGWQFLRVRPDKVISQHFICWPVTLALTLTLGEA